MQKIVEHINKVMQNIDKLANQFYNIKKWS